MHWGIKIWHFQTNFAVLKVNNRSTPILAHCAMVVFLISVFHLYLNLSVWFGNSYFDSYIRVTLISSVSYKRVPLYSFHLIEIFLRLMGDPFRFYNFFHSTSYGDCCTKFVPNLYVREISLISKTSVTFLLFILFYI